MQKGWGEQGLLAKRLRRNVDSRSKLHTRALSLIRPHKTKRLSMTQNVPNLKIRLREKLAVRRKFRSSPPHLRFVPSTSSYTMPPQLLSDAAINSTLLAVTINIDYVASCRESISAYLPKKGTFLKPDRK